MIIQTYKKTGVVFGSLLLLVMSVFLGSAAIGDNLDFDNLKEITLTAIDNSINRIENAKNTIMDNPKIDETTKTNSISALTNVQNNLTAYRLEVENTTTLTELREVNQEVIQYIRDNKDVIRDNIRMALVNLGQKFYDKAQELIEEVNRLLNVMKATCSEQTDKIEEIQGDLDTLEAEMATLEDAIQTKNTSVIKTQVRKIKNLSTSIVTDMKTLEEAC